MAHQKVEAKRAGTADCMKEFDKLAPGEEAEQKRKTLETENLE